MKFEEAVKLLKERREVRRKGSSQHLVLEGEHIEWDTGDGFGASNINWFTDDNWEEFKEEDDWSVLDEFKQQFEFKYSEGQSYPTALEKLKAKILERLKKKNSGNGYICVSDIDEVLDKSFGV